MENTEEEEEESSFSSARRQPQWCVSFCLTCRHLFQLLQLKVLLGLLRSSSLCDLYFREFSQSSYWVTQATSTQKAASVHEQQLLCFIFYSFISCYFNWLGIITSQGVFFHLETRASIWQPVYASVHASIHTTVKLINNHTNNASEGESVPMVTSQKADFQRCVFQHTLIREV